MVEHGSAQVGIVPQMRCLTCHETAYLTDWVTPPGIDHMIKQFICQADHESYRRYIKQDDDRTIPGKHPSFD